MMLGRFVRVARAMVVAASLAYGSGCSSSSGASTVDSGLPSTQGDTGTTARDSGKPHKDSSSHDTGARRDSTSLFHDAARDSKETKHDSSASTDAGTTCSPQGTWSFSGVAYVPAVGHQGLCTKAQIAAFVKACGKLGTEATCTAWLTAQVKPDAAGTCGDCIIGPHNNGAVWFESSRRHVGELRGVHSAHGFDARRHLRRRVRQCGRLRWSGLRHGVQSGLGA